MILIKSAQIIDGTGKPPFRADVLLKKDRISAIGNFPNKQADTVIDGLGFYLSPGFVDIQASSDHYLSLFTNPALEDFLIQGVTTAIGGHCGSSLAPLLYGTLESIQKWADPDKINVDWHSMHEFLDILKRRKYGINFGTLIGHSTIRRALIGEEIRDLTLPELNVFKHLVRESLHEGAFGLSTGLGYVHSKATSFDEVKELAETVAKENGIYSTHLRNEREGILGAVQETVAIAKDAGVKTLISHFRPILGFEKQFEEALNVIRKDGSSLDLHFNNYPFDTSAVPIYTLLPPWAQIGGREVMMSQLEEPKSRAKILKEFKNINGNEICVSQVAHGSGFDYLAGKTVEDFAKNQELQVPEALVKLMHLTDLRSVVFVKNVNLELALESLTESSALVTANSAGLANSDSVFKHERFTNTFPKFLEAVRKRGVMPIEAAIQKITSVPAQKLKLHHRGTVQEGHFADLALFSVSSANQFKVEHVFVNGAHVVQEQLFRGTLAGTVLRHK